MFLNIVLNGFDVNSWFMYAVPYIRLAVFMIASLAFLSARFNTYFICAPAAPLCLVKEAFLQKDTPF